jgi:hypothetical protein
VVKRRRDSRDQRPYGDGLSRSVAAHESASSYRLVWCSLFPKQPRCRWSSSIAAWPVRRGQSESSPSNSGRSPTTVGRARQGQPRHHLAPRRVTEDVDNLPAPEIIAREIVEDFPRRLPSSRPWPPRSKRLARCGRASVVRVGVVTRYPFVRASARGKTGPQPTEGVHALGVRWKGRTGKECGRRHWSRRTRRRTNCGSRRPCRRWPRRRAACRRSTGGRTPTSERASQCCDRRA